MGKRRPGLPCEPASSDPPERTKRLLFGMAVHCAFRSSAGTGAAPCTLPVVEMIDGDPAPGTEVAHIRAPQHHGPRHDCGYPSDVHGFDNLLLLCDRHHRHVDYHHAKYPVRLLEQWRDEQRAQPGARVLPSQVKEAVERMARLVGRAEGGGAGRVFVELVGGLGRLNEPPLPVLLSGMRHLSAARTDGETFLGVRAVNLDGDPVPVLRVGVDLGFDHTESEAFYMFPTLLSSSAGGVAQGPSRLPKAGDDRFWFAPTPAIGHGLRAIPVMPTRVRAWAALELGAHAYSTWHPLPSVVQELVRARAIEQPVEPR